MVPEHLDTALEDMDMTRDWLVLYQRVRGQQQVAALPLRNGLPAAGAGQSTGPAGAIVKPTPQSTAGAAVQQANEAPQRHRQPQPPQQHQQQPASAPLLTRAPLPGWTLSVVAGANADFDSPTLRLMLSSPVHPEATFDWQLGSQSLVCRASSAGVHTAAAKGQQPGSGAGPMAAAAAAVAAEDDAATSGAELIWQRLWARSADGTAVPLTVAHRAHLLAREGSGSRGGNSSSGGSSQLRPVAPRPCLLVVYGAYGHCLPTEFAPDRLPLLRDGWVLALAHVRGGGELGRRWHAAGRGAAKANSVADLEACLDHLFAAGELREAGGPAEGFPCAGSALDTTSLLPPGRTHTSVWQCRANPFVLFQVTMWVPSFRLHQAWPGGDRGAQRRRPNRRRAAQPTRCRPGCCASGGPFCGRAVGHVPAGAAADCA